MRFHRKAALALATGAALASGFAPSAYAQEWQTAVAQGTYAVYSVNRRVDGVAIEAEYFLQTFNADRTVTITSYVLKTPPAVAGGDAFTLAAALCEGTYTPVPAGQHLATCGDDAFSLLITATEVIDGVTVATTMRGMNTVRGTQAGEVLEYVYRRLPDGWENAVIRGTYAGYADFPVRGGQYYYQARDFIVNVPASGNATWHQTATNNPGETPGTRDVLLEPDFLIRNVVPNGRFPGIHQAVNIYGLTPPFDWLILGAEEIGGVMVVTEIRGFSSGANRADQWHYIRIGDAREGLTDGARLDPTLPPNFGEVTLATGFSPDPHTIDLRAGGDIYIDFAVLGPECFGFVTAAPSYTLFYTPGGGQSLTIGVTADADTTLIVRDPNGDLVCADDTIDLNPAVTFDNPPPNGRYDIWVGNYTAGATDPATLRISGQGVGP